MADSCPWCPSAFGRHQPLPEVLAFALAGETELLPPAKKLTGIANFSPHYAAAGCLDRN